MELRSMGVLSSVTKRGSEGAGSGKRVAMYAQTAERADLPR